MVDGLSGAAGPPVLCDLPGHGRYAMHPEPASFSLSAALGIVQDAGSWPDDLIGYSMGGRIALHFAAECPDRVRRLVLESASPGLATEAARSERRADDEELADRVARDGVAAFIESWERLPLFESQGGLPPHVLAHQRALRLRNTPAGLAGALRGLGTGRLPSLWSALPGIRTPTLLLAGSLDVKFVDIAERMVATMPDARLVIVEGAGHAVHVERPHAWLRAVVSFLSGM